MDVGQYRKLGCSQCLEGVGLDFDFSFAFQPIVNAADASIFAYEALARGLKVKAPRRYLPTSIRPICTHSIRHVVPER
ncbi:hypothetical protein ACFQDL_21555 [Marinobacterium aestuariivivens]|uniref:EAL domain-containing protein n=1 Tax=Marinobacterium aestuariivivens TaxID=1698799 RepID=A0ABW2A4C0_9GAMM